MSGKRNNGRTDVVFKHGVRFHVVSSEAPLARDPKGTVCVAWQPIGDELCAALIQMDQPWPTTVPMDIVTALFVQSLSQVDEAVAFVAANKAGTRH